MGWEYNAHRRAGQVCRLSAVGQRETVAKVTLGDGGQPGGVIQSFVLTMCRFCFFN